MLVNPTRVPGRSRLREEVNRALAQEGWPAPLWYSTSERSGGLEEARAAVAAGVEVLFVCGGDGTVRAAAEAVAGTGVALALLPLGTGNVLALNLGIRSGIASAVRLATSGTRRRIDVGLADGRCFVVAAGAGLDAQMLARVNRRAKRWLGWLAYAASVLRHLRGPGFQVTITVDAEPPRRRLVRSVLVANVGRLPGGLTLIPSARPDDGELDVAVIVPRGPREWLATLLSVLGDRPRGGRLETLRGRRVELSMDHPQGREMDGELLPAGDHLTVSVRPGALLVCVPGPVRAERRGGPSRAGSGAGAPRGRA